MICMGYEIWTYIFRKPFWKILMEYGEISSVIVYDKNLFLFVNL
jgi:hypothetical protein